MLPVEVDSTGYVDAVAQLAGANRGVVDAVNTLTDTLYGSGSMAGSDTGGTEWAGKYDPAAKQLVQAGCSMGDALANMANLLNGSLSNHAGADHAALIYPGEPYGASGDTNPDHGTESLVAPAPPSAAGGTGDQPGWWHWIAGHVGGLLWPDADTDQLRAAGSAWSTAGTTIADQQYAVWAADSALYAISSPEMDDVHGACGDIAKHLQDLGTMCISVGNACTDYAGYVDDKHQEVEDELKSFIEWTAVIEGGSFLLSEIGGEIWGQGIEGAEVSNAAGKVVKILTKLIELARTVKTAIETAVKGLAELVVKLGKFVNAKLVKALEETGVTLAKDLPEELDGLTQAQRKALIDLPKGSRPDPSTYLSKDYIAKHLDQFDDGATRFMTKANFDKYGIAQRDGTSFVMPKDEVDQLMRETGGDPRKMEDALGLPEGFFDNGVVRVDIKDPQDFGLRMPSGNEAGANDQWLPGGHLPTGLSEAVVDGGKVPPSDVSVTSMGH